MKYAHSVDNQVRLQVRSAVIGWVRCPTHVFMTSQPCAFKIVVDPTLLVRGGVYFGELFGFDEDVSMDAGPLFRVPVTVVCPEVVRGANERIGTDDCLTGSGQGTFRGRRCFRYATAWFPDVHAALDL